MLNIFKGIFSRFDLDRVFVYNLLQRVWMLAMGPFALVLILGKLTPEQQGFHFTFASILGISVFLDLGFTRAIMTFASHEFGHLTLARGEPLSGDMARRRRIASFGKAIVVTHLFLAVVAALFIGVAGDWFLGRNAGAVVAWRGAWWALALASGLTFLVTPMQTLVESGGQVEHMAWVRLVRQAATNLVLVGALWLGAGLTASAWAAWVGVAVALPWLWFSYRPFWRELNSGDIHEGLGLLRELLPFQMKIAASWALGYLIFSIMTPVAFSTLGPAEAGRMGLTWQVVALIGATAFSMIASRTPRLGALVGQGKVDDAAALSRSCTRNAAIVATLGVVVVIAGVVLVRQTPGWPWPEFVQKAAQSMLGPVALAALGIGEVAKLYVLGTIAFVRTFKIEPFLPLFIGLAVFTPLICWELAVVFGVEWLCWGYALSQLISVPWVFAIRHRHRSLCVAPT